jgi:hypothetical protein
MRKREFFFLTACMTAAQLSSSLRLTCPTGRYDADLGGTLNHSTCTVCEADHYCPGGFEGRRIACSGNSSTNGATGLTSFFECTCNFGFYCVMTNVSQRCVFYRTGERITVAATGSSTNVSIPVYNGVAAFEYDLWGAGGGGGFFVTSSGLNYYTRTGDVQTF